MAAQNMANIALGNGLFVAWSTTSLSQQVLSYSYCSEVVYHSREGDFRKTSRYIINTYVCELHF